jgi:SAM-dependent methyltransferase
MAACDFGTGGQVLGWSPRNLDDPRQHAERHPATRQGCAIRSFRSIIRIVSESPEGALGGRAVDRSVEDFDETYVGTPPWDIGRAQPVFAALMDEGAIRGRVLDAGCGTGEHTLMAAARGLDATGIDASPRAIEIAKGKATDRGVAARFLVWDALALAELDEQFDTVLDSGLFHILDDERRARYVSSLAAIIRPGGRVLLGCFSDRQPGDWGPRRVRQAELRDAFAHGWIVESIEPVQLHTNLQPPTAEAWLARIAVLPLPDRPQMTS